MFGYNIDRWRIVINYLDNYTEVFDLDANNIVKNKVLHFDFAPVLQDLTSVRDRIKLWLTFS